MGHASEYSRGLVSAEEAVRGTVRHHASSPPYLDEFPGQEEEDGMDLVVFPGLAHAAMCDLGREDFVHGHGAGDRKLHDQRLCNYRQDLTAPLPALCLMEVIMANLNSVFEAAAARHAERPAVRMDELVLSYSQLRDAAHRMASLLSSAGIVPGDRVAIMLPNVPAFPVAFYGALAAGAIVVPMNPLLKSREITY